MYTLNKVVHSRTWSTIIVTNRHKCNYGLCVECGVLQLRWASQIRRVTFSEEIFSDIYRVLVQDIASCLQYTTKTNYICTPSDTTTYFIVIILLATSVSLNGPSSGKYLQKLKNDGAYSTKMSILWDSIYIYQQSLKLLPAFRCATVVPGC